MRRIFGTDYREVGPELHCTVLEIDGVLKIHDAVVEFVRDSQGEVHAPGDAFISSPIAKRLPAEDVLSRCDFHPNNTSLDQGHEAN
jgi:hypothetical protein